MKHERERRLDVRLAFLGMTRRSLATQLGADPAAVTRLLRSGLEYAGGRVTWAAIATALGVPPAALEVGGPWAPLVGVGTEREGEG